MEVIAINDPKAEASEAPAIIVNVHNGRIKEIPCGPKDAAYVSGDRLVVWDTHLGRPVIPARHAGKWRFYVEFCSDPKIAAKHKLSLDESRAYFDDYLEFARGRGLGAKAKHIHGTTAEQVAALWHPEVRELRRVAGESGGQQRVDYDLLERITGRRKPAEEGKGKARAGKGAEA